MNGRHGPERRLRPVRLAAAAVAAAGFATVGLWWAADRSRAWEPPRWREAEFVRLDAGERGPAREIRVVPVNPECPHCAGHLRRARRAALEAPAVRLIALVVDHPRRPEKVPFASSGVDEVWWDRESVWRTRWGHRLYGETLVFDASGRLLQVAPAGAGTPGTDDVPPDH